jgi:outer membrane protein assembly factor BamB
VIYGFDNGSVGALAANNGTVLWEQSVATGRGRTELDRLADIDGAIGVYGKDMYVSSYNGRLASLAMESGRVLWVRDMASYSGVAVDGDGLYLTDAEDQVWRLDRRNGASLWTQSQLARRKLTVAVPAGDTVVVGDLEGYLHWLDKEDGTILARKKVANKPIQATPILIGDVLYVLGSGGRVGAYRFIPRDQGDS